jgi:hypothetical protein
MSLFQLLLLLPIAGPICGGGSAPQAPAVQNESLRQELRSMFQRDQQTRIGGMKAMGEAGFSFDSPASNASPRVIWVAMREQFKMSWQDAANRQRLKEIIKEHGWPGKSLVGADGANAAWLVVQHSDADVAFQKECLALMEAAPQGEVSRQEVAYLTDRVLVNEKKKQRYGTQMGMNFVPQPIEDPDNVDKRRAEIGLPPLAEYVKEAREGYNKMLTAKEAE